MLENKQPYQFPTKPMTQNYDSYTDESHEVWSILYNRQMKLLKDKATKHFFRGLDVCGFNNERIPVVEDVNKNLRKATGWEVYIVPGLIADKPFFEFLANKKFPVTTWVRKKEELEYLEEPDMFHDVFGHVPILSTQPFVDFVQGIGEVALKYIDNPLAVELMSRLYWFTVEFGLIREDGQMKIYGAGILSSIGESEYSVNDPKVPRYPYDVRRIFQTPFYKHDFQEQYFVIDNYEQLFESLENLPTILEEELKIAAKKPA